MPHVRLLILAALSATLFAAGAACAQGTPGDAAFCQQYADTAATAAEDAIASDPACRNDAKGVHGDRAGHFNWCSRTPSSEVEGASIHIRRLASQCTRGMLVAPEDYGGYAIVGAGQMEQPYGQARGWQVNAAFSGRLFMYCVAERNAGDRPVRIGVDQVMPGDSSQWQLAVPVRAKKEWEGRLEIDGADPAGGAGAQISGTTFADWSIAWLNMGQVDALRNGHGAVFGVGKADYDFSLEGVAAAILKVEECRARHGLVAQAGAPPAAPGPAAVPPERPIVNAPTIFALRANPQLCVRQVGGGGPQASDLALGPCGAATVFLFQSGGDVIRLSERTDACASVNRLPSPPEHVMVIPCRDTRDRWRFEAGSGAIANGDKYCWTVEGAARAGAKIVGTPCRGGAAAQQFDLQM